MCPDPNPFIRVNRLSWLAVRGVDLKLGGDLVCRKSDPIQDNGVWIIALEVFSCFDRNTRQRLVLGCNQQWAAKQHDEEQCVFHDGNLNCDAASGSSFWFVEAFRWLLYLYDNQGVGKIQATVIQHIPDDHQWI